MPSFDSTFSNNNTYFKSKINRIVKRSIVISHILTLVIFIFGDMSKNPSSSKGIADLSRFSPSTFTITFAVEILGIDVWHDCNEGWLDLGPFTQGMKIQYQLYPGQMYDLDILIWPHIAKIWCGNQYGWVRTWQFLERRWFTFSMRHVFPVRVADLQNHLASVTPIIGINSLGSNAKNDKNFEVYLPPLRFGERRYFGVVTDTVVNNDLVKFIQELIWDLVIEYIPSSCFDGLFDTPQTVTDVRHQDAVLHYVRETVLNRTTSGEVEEPEPETIVSKPRDRKDSKIPKEKEKKKPVEVVKVKFEISLSGDSVLAGTGRVIPFNVVGDRPPDLGEVIVLISTNNLPAQDDHPIAFVNVENLFDIPVDCLKKLRISHLYTRWQLGTEIHDSVQKPLKIKTNICFNDHHTVRLFDKTASEVCATFLDNPYEIQLRGIRILQISKKPPQFFGYEKFDRNFDIMTPSNIVNEDIDILIAVTKIDAGILSKCSNGFLKGEYPLYSPKRSVVSLERESVCTNDINAIRATIKPNLVVPPSIILEAQMTLEVSIGIVGCRPRRLTPSYSRMFSIVSDSDVVLVLLKQIAKINDGILSTGERDDLLTGFALDVGDKVVLFLEGPIDGHILRVWEITEDFYPKIKPIFSTSAKYSSRIYPELLLASMMSFNVLKMYIPLATLLACPPVYTRPALPLPTRSALLKIGNIIARKHDAVPSRSEMPTAAELKSFRLELCVAPRPNSVTIEDNNLMEDGQEGQQRSSLQSTAKNNWNK